jgi:hypothetical protein
MKHFGYYFSHKTNGPNPEGFGVFVFFRKDLVFMIIGIEFLAEIEGEFSEVRKFKGTHRVLDFLLELGSIKNQVPKIFLFLCRQVFEGSVMFVPELMGVFFRKILPFSEFAKNAVYADKRILEVGTCFPLETQGFLEIEDDEGIPGEFEHKIAKSPGSDLPSDKPPLIWRKVWVPFLHFGQSFMF